MKIEKITPQIAALYIGQKATRLKNRWDFTLEGVVGGGAYCVDGYVCPIHNIELYLRRLESMTEEEAREVYEIEYEIAFDPKNYDSAIPFVVRGSNPSKSYPHYPQGFLHLLSKGFDLFGLIDAGLAKEIVAQS